MFKECNLTQQIIMGKPAKCYSTIQVSALHV